jgi:hypothetical protein
VFKSRRGHVTTWWADRDRTVFNGSEERWKMELVFLLLVMCWVKLFIVSTRTFVQSTCYNLPPHLFASVRCLENSLLLTPSRVCCFKFLDFSWRFASKFLCICKGLTACNVLVILWLLYVSLQSDCLVFGKKLSDGIWLTDWLTN